MGAQSERAHTKDPAQNTKSSTTPRASLLSRSHAPNNQSTFLGGFTPKTMIISITRGVVSENSSDLSSGRRPQSKSVEFFETTPLEIEIRTLQSYSFFRKGDPFFGASLHGFIIHSGNIVLSKDARLLSSAGAITGSDCTFVHCE